MNDTTPYPPEEEQPKPDQEQPASTEPPAEPAPEPETSSAPMSGELPLGAMQVEVPHDESRLRRFARAALRWTLLAVLIFALGVAALYFLRLRPMQTEAIALQNQATQTADQYHTAQQDLMAAQEQNKLLQGQLEQANAERDLAVARYNLQKVYTDTAVARLAMTNKDGAMAKSALEQAQDDLAALAPAISGQDATLSEALGGRLDLVLNDLERSDTRTALADLDIFARDLQELEKKLFAQ